MEVVVIKIILYLTQVIALIVAIKHWNVYRSSSQNYFMHFMYYVVFHETLSIILRYVLGYKTEMLNNIYTIISFLFFYWWFYKILKAKKIILWMAFLFLISITISIINEHFLEKLWKTPLITGTFSILILVSLLFSEMLKNNEIINYFKSQRFWFATGLLIFYIGFLPVLFFQNVINTKSAHYGLIMTFLNVMLYGSFIIGFLCQPKQK